MGDTYKSPGNIELTLKDGRRVYVEVKFVRGGRGTRANIGQNGLTDLGLFKNAKSWSEFRKEKGHDKRVLEILNKFGKYPPNYHDLKSVRREVVIKATYLRDKILHVPRGKNTIKVDKFVNYPSI